MKRKQPSRMLLGIGGALLMLGGTLLTPVAAHAGADGRKNTTIALGAAAAYALLLKHQVVPGLVLGAGAAYAAKRYEDARHQESVQNNRSYYRRGYPYATAPSGYSNDNRYRNGNGNNRYGHGDSSGYYDPNQDNRNGDRHGRRHDDNHGDRNHDNQHGQKRGWNGRDLPPGQQKKHDRDRDDN